MNTTQTTTNPSSSALPSGTWVVDTAASELGFMARGMFGLLPGRGVFHSFAGTLEIDDLGARGELVVDAASADTKNEKRDAHLLTKDFFDVERYPTFTFSLDALTPAADGTFTLTGALKIRQGSARIESPVTVATLPDGRLQLKTEVKVDRKAAGLDQNNRGMVQGKAHLNASLVLARQ